MSSEAVICAVCAWRAACQKKFSISGKDVRCPDFVKDMSLKEPPDNKKEKEETEA